MIKHEKQPLRGCGIMSFYPFGSFVYGNIKQFKEPEDTAILGMNHLQLETR
jgi:hypothetical protein